MGHYIILSLCYFKTSIENLNIAKYEFSIKIMNVLFLGIQSSHK